MKNSVLLDQKKVIRLCIFCNDSHDTVNCYNAPNFKKKVFLGGGGLLLQMFEARASQ